MPVHAEGKKIIETATGRIKGRSRSPELAKKAARVRNAVLHGWQPTRRKPARSGTGAY